MFLPQMFILCLNIVIATSYSVGSLNKDACARFDCEEKLLEKVVRLEHRVEQIEKCENIIQSMKDAEINRTETIESITNDIKMEIERQRNNLEDVTGNFSSLYGNAKKGLLRFLSFRLSFFFGGRGRLV